MNEYLLEKRSGTVKRLEGIGDLLTESSRLCDGVACVYVTGSFGRLEAGRESDLDLFIVGKSNEDQRDFKRLDEILVKAELITATRKLAIPEFSGDGQYLEHYGDYSLVKELGSPSDDVGNTFTARLLLLLESRPLVGDLVYREIVARVVEAYWRDFEGHESDFIPAFLANDILRLWRTFCVNYEARTETEPAEKKAKRKLKNYKLKHSRLLTCYSALLYLLAVYVKKHSVSKSDAVDMTELTPIERVGYPLDSGSPNILWSALVRFGVPIGHDRAVRRGLGRDGLLDKAVEQLPAAA